MTKHDPHFEAALTTVQEVIRNARPDQILRLLRDVEKSGQTDHKASLS